MEPLTWHWRHLNISPSACSTYSSPPGTPDNQLEQLSQIVITSPVPLSWNALHPHPHLLNSQPFPQLLMRAIPLESTLVLNRCQTSPLGFLPNLPQPVNPDSQKRSENIEASLGPTWFNWGLLPPRIICSKALIWKSHFYIILLQQKGQPWLTTLNGERY